MSSREEILQRLRANTHETYPRPDLSALRAAAVRYDDPVAKFVEMTQAAGGKTHLLAAGETVADCVRAAFPEAKRIASTLPDFPLANERFSDLASQQDINGTDVFVVEGLIGVAENACVWLRQEVEQRAAYFISEALVIVLPRTALVHNMHEAYARPEVTSGEFGYAYFNSGPSKTADIEGALVFGAHGPRECLVILT